MQQRDRPERVVKLGRTSTSHPWLGSAMLWHLCGAQASSVSRAGRDPGVLKHLLWQNKGDMTNQTPSALGVWLDGFYSAFPVLKRQFSGACKGSSPNARMKLSGFTYSRSRMIFPSRSLKMTMYL